MAFLMRGVFSPFQNSYRYLRQQAHEYPVIFFSVVIGSLGPLILVTVPPIRERLGYTAAERPPTSYPVPRRPRRKVEGYEDP